MHGIARGDESRVEAAGTDRPRPASDGRRGSRRTIGRAPLAALLLLLAAVAEAPAGGGPETTLVVVNARSPLSRRIANEYVALRDIPTTHVLWLHGVPHQGVITLGEFRETILGPIERFLADEKLVDSIDLIAYSSGFPYGVDFRSRLPPGDPGHVIGGIASLTGVTFLAEDVKAGRPFWSLFANRYFRLVGGSVPPNPEETAALARAEAAVRAGRLEEGLGVLAEVLAAQPDLAVGWFFRACCLARLGRADEALAALFRAADTGFANPVHASNVPDLASLRSRPEFERVLRKMKPGYLPAHGFRCTQAWDREPGPSEGPGGRYRLAIHLAYTGPFGNSLPEVLAGLRSAAGADGTKPDGTVYLCRNEDVRSKAREGFFPPVIDAMGRIGRKIEVLDKSEDGQTGVLPVGKHDIVGAVVGIPEFDFGQSGSRILPGAILEHLTSFGAMMAPVGQTKFSEFLRYGAAGASGTVMEPLSIHFKFPNPMLHVHYAEGCSLAEAFYQNVGGPFQLMIAGDGLARPFATFAAIAVKAPDPPWRGAVRIAARAADCDTELWVDGLLASRGESVVLDTTALDDGWHDIRVVAVARDRIGTRSFRRIDAVVDNHGLRGSAQWSGRGPSFAMGSAVLEVQGGSGFEVLRGAQVVARTTGKSCEIPLSAVGSGPVSLVPRLAFPGGRFLRLPPLRASAEEPPPEPGDVTALLRLPGLRGMADTGDADRPVLAALYPHALFGPTLSAQTGPGTRIVLWGELETPEDGTWEFSFRGAGRLTVEIGGRRLLDGADLALEQFAALRLERGWHPVWIDLRPEGPPALFAAAVGPRPYGPVHFRHEALPRTALQPAVERMVAGPPPGEGTEGFVLAWKQAPRDVSAILLVPDPAVEGFPLGWTVEVPGPGEEWEALEGVTVLAGPPTGPAPSFVEISFPPQRPTRLRLRPLAGTARIVGLVSLGKGR
ncbi:MAG: hypothetical protein MUE73_15460 [Planctomycetes bacterium]|jgi:hypothetical protein|nr:hypothetical protein [Planctomycetota bacterium]